MQKLSLPQTEAFRNHRIFKNSSILWSNKHRTLYVSIYVSKNSWTLCPVYWDSMSSQKQQIHISFSAILVFPGVDWLSWLSVESILLSKATTTKGLTKGSS